MLTFYMFNKRRICWLKKVFPLFVEWTVGIIEVDLMGFEASFVLICKEFLLLIQKTNPVISVFFFLSDNIY
jgi:hypothetical protein